MDEMIVGLITNLLTLPLLVFSFCIALIVSILRKIVESVIKKVPVKFSPHMMTHLVFFWREWIVRGLPIVLGGSFAFLLKDYPFPEAFTGSDSARTALGLVAGLFSSTVYGFLKVHINNYLPNSVKEKLNSLSKTRENSNNEENI
jgi:Na+/H+-dicarboxylate symporter